RRAGPRGCAWPRRRRPYRRAPARPRRRSPWLKKQSWSVLPGEDGLARLRRIDVRVVESVVQSPALFAARGALDHQIADQRDRAQLAAVAGDAVVPVILADLLVENLEPSSGPGQALVGADDADVIPHQRPDLLPVRGHHHRLVRVDGVALVPGLDL